MNRLGWTDQIFREKMIATMRATTYGKIKFDDFTGSQTLYTEQEVAEIIERKINTRKAQYLWAKNQTVNEEELVSQGLGEVSAWWNSMMRRKLDEIKDKLDERCKELRVKFYTLPQSKKDTLLFIAIDKGLIVKDQYSMEVLPFLIPEMMQSFEKVIEG